MGVEMKFRSVSTMGSILLCIFLTLLMESHLLEALVTYDRKALIINGERRLLISGSIHYPRSTPEMWPDLIKKAKASGLNAIDTYVFWSTHEPSRGIYNFEGRYDLVKFIRTVQKEGLYVVLRIGPYICAEWNFGGFPVWLKFIPGISFRTDNEPFKAEMQRFVEKIVGMMRSENLFEPLGGNIILTQVENEYGHQEQLYGTMGYNYMKWAANMSVSLGTGVPWIMCKQDDAPDPVINTCNGFYCDNFFPNKPYKPTMWTEAWSGWYILYGHPIHLRPVEDLAFAVAQFFSKGGTFVNYYMYYGGTNLERTGAALITASYDYDAPIDEYGLFRQPKGGHLAQLHRAIRMCEPALVSADPMVTVLGTQQQAHVFLQRNGHCVAFLSNHDTEFPVRVVFNNMTYNLPAASISILPDCKNVVFNTAKVSVQTSTAEMLPSNAEVLSWEMYSEDLPSRDDISSFTAFGLLDQINVTMDMSDYLWYQTNVYINSHEAFLFGEGELPTLEVLSSCHSLLVFVNEQLTDYVSGNGRRSKLTFRVNFHARKNSIALLCGVHGLPDRGKQYESWATGIRGPVVLYVDGQEPLDLSLQKWTYQTGLKGEAMNIFSVDGVNSVDWLQDSLAVQKKYPLTWYKSEFDAPGGDDPLGLDLSSMGKGQAWINGESIGRYSLTFATGTCASHDYSVRYQPEKFERQCGQPTQRMYHVPRSWLRPTKNQLVVFEESGGNPTLISLVKRVVTRVCADISESHPIHIDSNGKLNHKRTPKLVLQCDSTRVISSIEFASFGVPFGACGQGFKQGLCHSPLSASFVERRCLWKRRCSIHVSANNFGHDPCPNTMKRLVVEATCGLI